MQQTDVSTDVLDSLDFEPCCEGESERHCISLGTPARWLVLEPCGCLRLFCDFHKDRREFLVVASVRVQCTMCGSVVDAPVRVTPL